MTVERMLELLIASKVLEKMGGSTLIKEGYDPEALEERAMVLLKEFLNPYVIDNAPKGE